MVKYRAVLDMEMDNPAGNRIPTVLEAANRYTGLPWTTNEPKLQADMSFPEYANRFGRSNTQYWYFCGVSMQ
jgi:hypothetical protein